MPILTFPDLYSYDSFWLMPRKFWRHQRKKLFYSAVFLCSYQWDDKFSGITCDQNRALSRRAELGGFVLVVLTKAICGQVQPVIAWASKQRYYRIYESSKSEW